MIKTSLYDTLNSHFVARVECLKTSMKIASESRQSTPSTKKHMGGNQEAHGR
jgi:hypothetical protein